MTGDDHLEHDLRATLDDLAREPASDDLVARVGAIPAHVPSAPSLGARLFGGLRGSLPGFAAVAAVVVLAVVAVALRPASGPPVGGSASIAIGPTGAPTPVPTTEPRPILSPSPLSSATPGPKPTPGPTGGPVAGEPVPDTFQPLSVTFVSTTDGWVLGRGVCGDRDCPVIARTTDGGESWTTIVAPPTNVVIPSSVTPDAGPGVSGLRFATVRDGWAYGPGLWATHDGGSTWTPVHIAGLPAAGAIVALESARGVVHVVFYDGALFRIATSPIGSDAWTEAPIRIDLGAGPVPSVQLVLSGAGGWLLVNNRVVIAGARLHSGEWANWQPPCGTVTGPAVVAAPNASDLISVCDVGLWGDPGGQPIGEHGYVSHDGGITFVRVSSTLPIDTATAIAAGSAESAVLAAGDDKGTVLLRTADGGRTWTSILQPSLEQVSELGFTTGSQGVLILTDDQGQGRLLMTHDGGRTWKPVRFQP